MDKLSINKLTSYIANKIILKNFSLQAKSNDVIAILGPNGAGKTTILKTIMNHFSTKIKNGLIKFNNHKINGLGVDAIAKLGIFYVTQHPLELDGVNTLEFLKIITKLRSNNNDSFYQLYSQINKLVEKLDLPSEILTRSINVGFSGGQKKKHEMLQAELFKPKILLLDEIDSGLDIDTIGIIANFINSHRKNMICLVISHHLEFLQKIKPNKVIILVNGQIAKVGDISLVKFVEKNGYKQFSKNVKYTTDFEITDPYLSCHK